MVRRTASERVNRLEAAEMVIEATDAHTFEQPDLPDSAGSALAGRSSHDGASQPSQPPSLAPPPPMTPIQPITGRRGGIKYPARGPSHFSSTGQCGTLSTTTIIRVTTHHVVVDRERQPVVSARCLRHRADASANNSQLSELEGEVLWEYAKLGDKIRRVGSSRPTATA